MEESYQERIYQIARQIPKGSVTTYGAIADYLALGSARMVGWALRHCTIGVTNVPAHRVVNRNGELSGRNHFPTPTLMQELLEQEGVEIENNCVKDFRKRLWFPSQLEDKSHRVS